ncbi:molybdate transport system ATP-binding protein [Nocardioides scoriae]|uniref:Molybdate transport system ATP-binding protein n=1 Tax=Nocardioides scoriae TaxID=642780 RepID=A0A1H1MWD3_9ACTN|nr:ATP-binding cassette domain-containing protein [Nocardioides scoriae]SDR91034.1 molybdate transport system ATP-binding protein [Nocardioides scoriae]
MSLELAATVAERDLDVSLSVGDGEVVALLGPNGSGKSTALGLVAGLVHADTGAATLDGRTLFDTARRTWTEPHRRGVALLAQEPLLFPHLSALDNVAFGPRSQGRSRAESRDAARSWLRRVDAEAYAARRPAQLSGGQAQRIAVARALAADPRLLLLDEPMAALDVDVAPALRQVLRDVLAGRSAVVVTHDVLDALLLADRAVVLEAGRVVEDGPTAQVLSRPRSAFAARIAGLNMVRGRWQGHTVVREDGTRVEGHPHEPLAEGDAVVAVFRPSAVAIFRTPPEGSPRNVVEVTVTELEPIGDQVRVRAALASADVTPAAVAELDLAPGVRAHFVVKASEVSVYRQ